MWQADTVVFYRCFTQKHAVPSAATSLEQNQYDETSTEGNPHLSTIPTAKMSLLKRTTTAAATASSRALLHTTVQSYATPLSDFMGPTVTEVRTAATKVLRQPQPATTMSFATPYADAVGPRPAELHRLAAQPPRPFAVDIMATPSSLSFASPESDYTAPLAREQAWAAEVATMPTMLSFASPESDFVAGPTVDGGDRVSQAAGSWLVAALVDSPWLSFASPMADVQAAAPVPRHLLVRPL